MNDLTGQTIKGYELHDLLGAGGFGAVYRAHQPVLRRDVAMKIILPEYANHPDFIRRFEFEAQLVARLEHIHIVSLYDYWREPDGAFLIMRMLRGGSLRAKLKGGAVSNEMAVRITEQIAQALAAAHRRNVVHRDIKPDNILFDEEGNAYLADFGIAKDLRDATVDGEEDLDDGALTGSPFYLAPEQAQSQPVSPQTDLYSMGIVIFEMLVGHPPFRGEQGLMAILLQHINDPLPSILNTRPDLPPTVDMVIQRATAKDPLSRYPDALSLAIDFKRALQGVEEQAARPARTDDADIDDMLVITKPMEAPGTGAQDDDMLVITSPLSPSTLIVPMGDQAPNPYKGLQAFEEADASDFFGRDMLIDRLLDRLRDAEDELHRFLAVIGPSGSGKSSVVKAGVIPSLRQGALPGSDQWYMAEMVPGNDPFVELTTALLSIAATPPENLYDELCADENGLLNAVRAIMPEGSELLLVIDQFEEVFTTTENEDARTLFLDNLRVATTDPESRVRIIITMRADFYDRPLNYPAFGELVRLRNEVVLPLSPDEIREAIIGPVERVGIQVETGLVAAMVADIAEQPGALPLMQYALTEIFDRRDGNVMTLDAYHETGSVSGALARRAEELYQETSAGGQAAMRQVFLRLVTLGEGAQDTRRRTLITELLALAGDADDTVIRDVLDLLTKFRLLTSDADPETRIPTLAVAHEALIRKWDRLRNWLDDNREDILLQRRLAVANDEWQKQGRDPSFLARGMRLTQFEQLVAHATIALIQEEIKYVQISVTERERLEEEERLRQAREAALEQRNKQILTVLAAVMAVAAVIGIILALYANTQKQEAEDSRDVAEEQRGIAEDERENAEDQRATAVHNAEVAEEQRQIADAQRVIAERSAEVNDSLRLAASAQTEYIKTNNDLAIRLALYGVEITDPPVESQFILSQAALTPGTHRLIDVGRGFMLSVVYHPDGHLVLNANRDGTLTLWDVATGELVYEFPADDPETEELEGHSDGFVRRVRFSPDGTLVLSGGRDGRLIVWDLESREMLWHSPPDDAETEEIEGHADDVRDIDFSPLDPNLVITSSDDDTLILWNIVTGEMVWQTPTDDAETEDEIEGSAGNIRESAISPDGQNVVSVSYDKNLYMWDMATGELVRIFFGHTDKVASIAYHPDGTRIVSGGGGDQTIRVWDAETAEQLLLLGEHGGWVKCVKFAPDGRLLLSSGDDNIVRLWDFERGVELFTFNGHTAFVEEASFSPDGNQIISSSGDETLRIWDIKNGAEIQRFWGHTDQIEKIVVSPDGTTILSGSPDSTVRMWDIASGDQIGQFDGLVEYETYVTALAISPAGRLAVIGDSNGVEDDELDNVHLWLWNIETGEIVHELKGHTWMPWSAAFHPNGQWVATGSRDATIIIWDIATGEMVRQFDKVEAEDAEEFYTDVGISALAFNADGSLLFSGGDTEDPELVLWNLAADDPAVWGPADIAIEQEVSGSGVAMVAFSPDDTRLLVASKDSFIYILDAATGALVQALEGHTESLRGAFFAADGTQIISYAEDHTIRVWDIDTELPVYQITVDSAVWGVAVTPDRTGLLTGGIDTILRLWDVELRSLDTLVQWTRDNRYVPELTCRQRDIYKLTPCEEAEEAEATGAE